MWACGCDWAEKHLDFCLQNVSGDVVLRRRVDNNEAGFNTILSEFSQLGIDSKDVAVAIESPHEPVVDFLLACGITVYPVNPTAIEQYRKSLKVSGSKSSQADAQRIGDSLRLHHQTLRAFFVSEPALRELQLRRVIETNGSKKRSDCRINPSVPFGETFESLLKRFLI